MTLAVVGIRLWIRNNRRKAGKFRVAFLHPFWYSMINAVMMEVGERKFFGAWSKP